MNIQKNHSLKKHNSFAIEAKSRYFCQIESEDHIDSLLEWQQHSDLPLLLLGGGSNILFINDYQGMTALINTKGITIVGEDSDFTYIKVNAGENWHQFVRWTVENNYAGLENLSLIPGTVGAAPMQNIGAYGVELADLLHELKAIELTTGKSKTFTQKECFFSYRDSFFKSSAFGKYLIQSITIKSPKKPHWNINYEGVKNSLEGKTISAKTISNSIIALRQSKLPDPFVIGNAGSFFKNPLLNKEKWQTLKELHPNLPGYPQTDDSIKISAAWLIDKCGWKGKRQGNAGVYKKHALVLVNHGGATGKEIWGIANDIINTVNDKFGIELEAEPRIIV
ncbi:MAG: UDP-N-acetylmuramate dehydrogenase [Cocleimonas sp.]|nr:UDP-N-acetylmuramate dehydrogenase [Cocleimonas sp.]